MKTGWIRIGERNAEAAEFDIDTAKSYFGASRWQSERQALIVIILSRPESGLGAAAVLRPGGDGFLLPVTGLLLMRLNPSKARFFAPARRFISLS